MEKRSRSQFFLLLTLIGSIIFSFGSIPQVLAEGNDPYESNDSIDSAYCIFEADVVYDGGRVNYFDGITNTTDEDWFRFHTTTTPRLVVLFMFTENVSFNMYFEDEMTPVNLFQKVSESQYIVDLTEAWAGDYYISIIAKSTQSNYMFSPIIYESIGTEENPFPLSEETYLAKPIKGTMVMAFNLNFSQKLDFSFNYWDTGFSVVSIENAEGIPLVWEQEISMINEAIIFSKFTVTNQDTVIRTHVSNRDVLVTLEFASMSFIMIDDVLKYIDNARWDSQLYSDGSIKLTTSDEADDVTFELYRNGECIFEKDGGSIPSSILDFTVPLNTSVPPISPNHMEYECHYIYPDGTQSWDREMVYNAVQYPFTQRNGSMLLEQSSEVLYSTVSIQIQKQRNVTEYYLYGANTPFNEINDATLIHHASSLSSPPMEVLTYESEFYYNTVQHNHSSEGTYYYSVLFSNGTHNSSLSTNYAIDIDYIEYTEQELAFGLLHYKNIITEDYYYTVGDVFSLAYKTNLYSPHYYVYQSNDAIITDDDLAYVESWQDVSNGYLSIEKNFSNYDKNDTEEYWYAYKYGNGTVNSSLSNIFHYAPKKLDTPTLELGDVWEMKDEGQMGYLFEWEHVAKADSYEIWVSTDDIDRTLLGTTTDLSTTVILTENVTHYFEIRAIANQTYYDGEFSNIISLHPHLEHYPPVLNPIASPSTTGNITLSWSSVYYSNLYTIYRSDSIITTLDGLSPYVVNLETTTFEDINLTNGTYYYVVVAGTESIISNCENVSVEITHHPPVLNPIASPSTTGNITLSWSSVYYSNLYTIYRSDSVITTLDGLSPYVVNLETTTFEDINLTNGTYYYVVVAGNETTFSNCEHVLVELSSDTTNIPSGKVSSTNWIVIGGVGGSIIVIGIIAIGFIKSKSKS